MHEVIKIFFLGKYDEGLNIYYNCNKIVIKGICNVRRISVFFLSMVRVTLRYYFLCFFPLSFFKIKLFTLFHIVGKRFPYCLYLMRAFFYLDISI